MALDSNSPKADRQPPQPQSNWALFLDIDGTLLEIASRPEAVIVPANLPALLEAASERLHGALAVVSGRPLTAIDHLLSPLTLPCAAEHGAILRLPDGTMLEPPRDCTFPVRWRERIFDATRDWKGVLVGNKVFSVAIHYRLAPEWEKEVQTLAQGPVAENPEFEVLPARMAIEIRHRSLNKGEAVRQFMRVPPFSGRVPVFIGDDVTDEDGFRAASEMGGLRLHVNDVFEGQPANVRAWLQTFAG